MALGARELIGAPISISFVYWGEIFTAFSCANRLQLIQVVQGIILQRGSSHTQLWITKGERYRKFRFVAWFVASEERDCDDRGTLDTTGQRIVPYLPPRVR